MHKLITTVVALGAMMVIPAGANAVTIHRHTVIQHRVGGLDAGRPAVVADIKTRVVTLKPPDGDQDGVANADDQCPSTIGSASYSGCPPPAPKPSPAPAPTPTPTYSAYSAPAPTTTSTGGCPSYMSGEASSPTAVNSSSGASGCYQVLPSTAAAMGSACSDVNSSSCVAAICATSGNAAWASSGSTPCDYIQP